MKPGRRICLALMSSALVFGGLTLTQRAFAQASIWDAARDPRLRRAEQLLSRVETQFYEAARARARARSGNTLLLLGLLGLDSDSLNDKATILAAIRLLEVNRATELPDRRLWFLLGRLYVATGESPAELSRGRDVLEKALRMAQSSPLAPNGWYELGILYARLDDPAREYDAYTHALEAMWDPDRRASTFYNRCDTDTRLRKLKEAVSDCQTAISLAQDPMTQVLAYLALGVALERSGDLPAGLKALAIAANMRVPSTSVRLMDFVLALNEVFFVPPYEEAYIRGLTDMAVARSAPDPKIGAAAYKDAIGHFEEYLKRAEPDREPWVVNARRLLETCQRELAKLEKTQSAQSSAAITG
jgi:tetratricopeptide (TPR) repeat protein